MKHFRFLAVFFLFAAFVNANSQWSDDEILQECKEQENVTDEDIQTIANHSIPVTRGSKCVLACSMEKIGVVSQMNSR